MTDAKQQTISYAYDDLDRLTGKNGTGLSVSYTYDGGPNGVGRRTGMTDGAGTAGYGYDARGRLASLTRVINGTSYPLTTTYDEQDRVATKTYPNGDALGYFYGDNGRPATLILNGNIFLVKEATYTQLHQLATLPLGNGLVTQYHHYALDTTPPSANEWFGRLAQVVTGGVQNQSISSYDGVGNPTGLSYTDHTSESFAASYNEWDQLTAYGSLEGYAYIAGSPGYDIGTLQSKGAAGYTYPSPGQARPHAPTGVSGIGGYGYDANGNRSSDPASTYSYDVENHLTQLVQGGTTVLQNTFDGDGVRLVRVAQGVTTHFVGQWYEANPATGVATAYYPFNGRPVGMKAGGTLSFLHRDHLDSLVSATDQSGNELGWARYYPFGALRLGGGALPTDRLFTGQTRDLGDDRRYWFKARAYDATLGQFQSPDLALPRYDQGPRDNKPPNGPDNPQTLDRYAYGLNNPLRLVDPPGRHALDPADQVGSGFGDFAFGGGLVSNTVIWTIDSQGHPAGSKGFNRDLPSWQGLQEFCTLVSAASILKYYGATGQGQDLAVAIAQTLGKLDVVWPSPNGGGPPPHGTTPIVAYMSRPGTVSSLDLAIEAVARAHGLPHLVAHTDFGPWFTEWPQIESALRVGHPLILNVSEAPSGVVSHSVIAYALVRGNLLVVDPDFPGQTYTWSETAAKLHTLTVTFLNPGNP